jgi:hypothetical protein
LTDLHLEVVESFQSADGVADELGRAAVVGAVPTA